MGVRIRIQSVKHMWLWQVFEHPSNRNGANVLFHQLKQLYHVVRDLFHVYLNKFEFQFSRLHVNKINNFCFLLNNRRVPCMIK